jgi:hypothetical protein
MAARVSNRKLSQVLLVVLFALMINLPLAHSTYTGWRIEHHGDQVTAVVTDHRERGSEQLLQFRFPSTVDPDQTTWTVEVDEATYDDAVASGRLSVRVLPDNPAAWHAEGEQTGHVALGITLIADLALIAAVLLLARHRGRLRPELRMVAVEDVVRCPPPPSTGSTAWSTSSAVTSSRWATTRSCSRWASVGCGSTSTATRTRSATSSPPR